MFITKLKEYAVSGKLTLIIRVAFIGLVLASSLLGAGDVLAGPAPGGVGA